MYNVVGEYRQLLVLHNYSWRVESHEIRSWLDNQIYIARKYVDAQQCTAVTGLPLCYMGKKACSKWRVMVMAAVVVSHTATNKA